MSILRDMHDLQHAQWSAQLKWAKRYATFIGLPAWLLLSVHQGGDFIFPPLSDKVALGLFYSATLIQLACLFRSYWRMDI